MTEAMPRRHELEHADGAKGWATISPCGTYRYRLGRRLWSYALGQQLTRGRLLWIMLNPSTADAVADDPTIRRCVGFSLRERFHTLEVVNLYALRATDPTELAKHPEPVGKWWRPELLLALQEADVVVAAWGAHRMAAARVPELLEVVTDHRKARPDAPSIVECLGRTKAGHPRHPLYLRADSPLQAWRAA